MMFDRFMDYVVSFVLVFACIWVGSQIAKSRGRSAMYGALWALLCGPFGLVILLLLPRHNGIRRENDRGLQSGFTFLGRVVELEGTTVVDDDLAKLKFNDE